MRDKLIPWKKRSALPERRRCEDSFDVLHRELNELFDGYGRGFSGLGRRMAGSAGLELSETEDEIRVTAELPGMDKKDITVELEEDRLIIRGERKETKETRKRNFHMTETSFGGYHRMIPLPARIDRERAKAKYKRGVLILDLPKTDRDRVERTRIPVAAG